MRVFMDCEFAQLGKVTQLVSIGFVAENGAAFYGEVQGVDPRLLSDWVRENVVERLWLVNPPPQIPPDTQYVVGNEFEIAALLEGWLQERGSKEDPLAIWSDVYAWDWVLFCDLFGGMLNLPECVYYIPFDLATFLWSRDIDPDISREEFIGWSKENKHNALFDAAAIRACFLKASAKERAQAWIMGGT